MRRLLAAVTVAATIALAGFSPTFAAQGGNGGNPHSTPTATATTQATPPPNQNGNGGNGSGNGSGGGTSQGDECQNGNATNNPHCVTPTPSPTGTPSATPSSTPSPTETPPAVTPPGDDNPPQEVSIYPGTVCRLSEYLALVTYGAGSPDVHVTQQVRGVEDRGTGVLWVPVPWSPMKVSVFSLDCTPAVVTTPAPGTMKTTTVTPPPFYNPPYVPAAVPTVTVAPPSVPDAPNPPAAGDAGLLVAHDGGASVLLVFLTLGTILMGRRMVRP